MRLGQIIFFGISSFSLFSYNVHDLQSEIILRENPNTETVYEYGDDGRIKEVHHEDGTVEEYEYDKNGNLIQITVRTGSPEPETPSGENAETTTETPSGENAETTTQTPSGENAETTTQTPSGENAETTTEASPGENADTTGGTSIGQSTEKTDANENDTADNTHIEICFLIELISIILLIFMWENRKQGGRKYE